MTPTQSDLHINVPLTNISLAYMQEEAGFIAPVVFPVIPVSKQSDRYYKYSRADFNRNQVGIRAPGAESAGSGWTVSDDNYMCDVRAVHKDIPDQVRANADSVFQLDEESTMWCTHQHRLDREIDWVTNFFGTGKWATEKTGVAATPSPTTEFLQWQDGDSTPVEDIRNARTTVKEATGFRPNTLVLASKVYDQLVDHPGIIDRIKGGAVAGNPAIVNRSLLAALFEVERLLVMDAIQNTANEGAAEVSSFIAGKHALLCYVPGRPGLMTPSAGYTFAWRGYLGGSSPVAVSRFRMDLKRSDRVEMEAAYDHKLTASDLGYFFLNAVA